MAETGFSGYRFQYAEVILDLGIVAVHRCLQFAEYAATPSNNAQQSCDKNR
ncbi:MAG: hypothetical protein AB4042_07420 [Leptolyngbyaceae cyanobacterium]